jgi:Flp pilus assembly protein TadG
MKTCARPSRRTNQCRGAAALELVLILPMLITIAFGCVDLGRFYHSRFSVTNAASAGARWAALNSETSLSTAWQQSIRQKVIDEMDHLHGFDQSQLTVSVTRDFSSGPFPLLRVEVQYPFSMVVSWPLLPNSFPLKQTAEMRAVR